MTPVRVVLTGRYYPEHPREPFEEHMWEAAGDTDTTLLLSFLWDAACLKEICQARIAGFAARGDKIQEDRKLILHVSDLCVVSAVVRGDEMVITIEEKIVEFEGRSFRALGHFEHDEGWAPICRGRTPQLGDLVPTKQHSQPVRIMGFVTTARRGRRVSNLVYPIRQTDAPHPSERALKAKIEAVRKGKRMPYSIPKMAIGLIFSRDIDLKEDS